MPKLIDYPRTSYTGAWELAEIVDDTGGKCAIETAAKKLNRKVSGSFKAIIGSAVKFGLITSKRELLSTTTLFRRIKHAYDKAEELQFHREAFLTPPLFTQICRKFRSRELPVQMLDVMLIREFGVEEINAQNVAKAFVDGCRMCDLLDERNIVADIDAINNKRVPRRELVNQAPVLQPFIPGVEIPPSQQSITNQETVNESGSSNGALGLFGQPSSSFIKHSTQEDKDSKGAQDVVANLFGLANEDGIHPDIPTSAHSNNAQNSEKLLTGEPLEMRPPLLTIPPILLASGPAITNTYQMQMSGPGVNTALDITDEADLSIAIALLEKIRRQLRVTNA